MLVDNGSDICSTLANVFLKDDRFVVNTFDDSLLALEILRRISMIFNSRYQNGKMNDLVLYKGISR